MTTIAFLGNLTIGAVVPIAVQAQAQLELAIGIGLPTLKAKLAGLIQMSLALTVTPPAIEIAAKLRAAAQVLLGLEASLRAKLPGVSLQATALIGIIAELELQLGALNAAVSFAADIAALLAIAGVAAYTYNGRADQFGPEFTSRFSSGIDSGGGPAASTNALVLVTTSAATWTGMQAVFKTS